LEAFVGKPIDKNTDQTNWAPCAAIVAGAEHAAIAAKSASKNVIAVINGQSKDSSIC